MFPRLTIVAACALLITAGLGGCASPGRVATREPYNLSALKREIGQYVDSGAYQQDLDTVARQADGWLRQRAASRRSGERLAVVFDLDETLLLNVPHIRRNDYGYLPAVWQVWVDQAAAPAIEPVRDVYRTARSLGIDVFYITGRTERDRPATVQNLRAIDCADYVELICKPESATGTSAAYKTAARQRLAEAGWVIVASIGDQESDLIGGFTERTFKLPNPFYSID